MLCTICMLCGCGEITQTTSMSTAVKPVERNSKEALSPTMEAKTVTGFHFNIPDGFTEDPSSSGIYIANDESGSSIAYSNYSYTDSITEYSESSMKKEMELELANAGYEVPVTIVSFESIKVDGYDGYLVDMKYEYGDKSIHQLEVIVITDTVIGNIIYTDVNDSGHMEQFQASTETISIQYES